MVIKTVRPQFLQATGVLFLNRTQSPVLGYWWWALKQRKYVFTTQVFGRSQGALPGGPIIFGCAVSCPVSNKLPLCNQPGSVAFAFSHEPWLKKDLAISWLQRRFLYAVLLKFHLSRVYQVCSVPGQWPLRTEQPPSGPPLRLPLSPAT